MARTRSRSRGVYARPGALGSRARQYGSMPCRAHQLLQGLCLLNGAATSAGNAAGMQPGSCIDANMRNGAGWGVSDAVRKAVAPPGDRRAAEIQGQPAESVTTLTTWGW